MSILKRIIAVAAATGLILVLGTCGGSHATVAGPDPAPGGSMGSSTGQAQYRGVLMWKGSTTGNGVYSTETTLTPQNVNTGSFGRIANFQSDGVIMAQPLYVANLDMGAQGVHNVVIIATERDEVLAFDADGRTTTPLWRRSYLGSGITTAPDNYDGRTTIGTEIGITGTPVIDSATGAMYFVTMFVRNGTIEQWLRAINVKDGQDFGPGSVQIQANLPGDGPGSVNGNISFDPSIQNQRPGLTLLNGAVVIAWGSFSDWGVYRGWVMAYDSQTLQQKAVFSSATQFQSQDDASGPADHGGGGAFWAGGAAPSIDSNGNVYVVAADGSFNADSNGGKNYGNSVLKLALANNTFRVVDYYSPGNRACLDASDMEIGSGGVVLLPADASASRQLALVVNKEGRIYVLDRSNLGKFDMTDSQIPQQLLIGSTACYPGMSTDFAEGTGWMRLYGNATYWNGNVYVAPANTTLRQHKFSGTLSTSPTTQSSTVFGMRGGSTVVSANGSNNAIVWAYNKNVSGRAELHAYDANDVSHELWNTTMNAGRDGMSTGTSFGTAIVVDGKVIAASTNQVSVYGLLK